MSRKDYVAIAEIIRTNCDGPHQEDPTGPYRSSYHTAKGIAEDLATLLAKENDRFDRDRFLAACGVQS